jgi:hypothetical protein
MPGDHPLRPIRKIADEILKEISPKFQEALLRRGASVDCAGAAVEVAAVADLRADASVTGRPRISKRMRDLR